MHQADSAAVGGGKSAVGGGKSGAAVAAAGIVGRGCSIAGMSMRARDVLEVEISRLKPILTECFRPPERDADCTRCFRAPVEMN